jgi:hypothetical protein
MKILPEEIPDDTAPLTEIPLEISNAISTLHRAEGQNVFVSLLTGKTLIGLLEWQDEYSFTVGNSDAVDRSVVESARIV